MSELANPVVIARATTRDEDSAVHLERIEVPDGSTVVALWGTEDSAPDVTLAYTLVPEETFIAFLREAGYTVTPGGAS